MAVTKCRVAGSDYVGVFATATDRHVFMGNDVPISVKTLVAHTLDVEAVEMSIFASDLIGIFSRANSNGIIVSNLIDDRELDALKKKKLGINIAVLESGMNAIGNNIIANDKIALINEDYSNEAAKVVQDTLGVEVVRMVIGGFKTLGANNIMTNKGFVINNRSTDEEKEQVDKLIRMKSVSTTANTGSVNIGLSVITNSKGIVVGDATTGFELARIMEGLELE
jgi:translation initiation factor 6